MNNRNKFIDFEDEIPVRSASGSFYVVREKHESGRIINQKSGIINQELGIKKLAPLPPAIITQSGSLKSPFIFSAADEEEAGKLGIMNGESRIINHKSGIRNGERRIRNQELGINDIIQKKEEVEHDVEEKIGKIMGEILNFKFKILKKYQISNDKFQNGKEVEEGRDWGEGESLKFKACHELAERVKSLKFNIDRFKNLLKTRIKGTRNNLKLWQALVKKELDGGMGMREMEADSIVKIVNGVLERKDEKEVEEGEDGGISNPFGKLRTSFKFQKDERNKEVGKIEDFGIGKIGEEGGISSFKFQILKKDQISNDKFQKGELGNTTPSASSGHALTPLTRGELGKRGENDVRNFYAVSRPAGESGKPKIEDIKYKTKLTGPVEEIASLKIKDFRHLSDNPEKALEIIKNKIDALEEESFAKRIEGIKAWRSSEIYKAYLEMGRRAISERIGIGEISNFKSIRQAQDKFQISKGEGGRNLTEEEFYAIMGLNKKLRF